MKKKTMALVGNPNSGKTSLFNALTGANQSVGNWPGVTVEKKEGQIKQHSDLLVQDLPGIYSLSPYTPEEVVARDYLIEERPDALLNIIDASNLERHLYLTTQLLELGIPMIVALNMMDVLEKQGSIIHTDKLAYALGVPVIKMSVIKNKGLSESIHNLEQLLKNGNQAPSYPLYDNRLEVALEEIASILPDTITSSQKRWYSIKFFERDQQVLKQIDLSESTRAELEEIITITEKIFKEDSESIIINERYAFISTVVALCSVQKNSNQFSVSDYVDRVVTNRWLAFPIFAGVMWLVYYLSIQTVGTFGTDWVNDVFFGNWVPQTVEHILTVWKIAPWLQALILEGIIAGVGAVLGFLPQLMVLFLCLSFLEDCGYMSRIAFVMDRFFRRFGLSGKSFIPMLVSTGCGVPGIMACRTIENERDRKMTIMTTTFMPCSAKLPIIGLITGAFFPHQTWVAPSAYFVGMAAIVLSGIILKKTRLFQGDTAPFIMELPDYHWPRVQNSVRQTWERSKSFVKKAGTVIFASSVIIWFLSSFDYQGQMVETSNSLLATMGRSIAPVFKPLGWGSWEATVSTITGLIAKENVVGTFGVLFGQINNVSETEKEYWPLLSNQITPIAGYSFLLFNLLCAPCFAAIGAIRREMNDWRWTTFAVGYQTGLAYLVSFVVYQFGHVMIEEASFNIETFLAVLVVMIVGYLLVRKPTVSKTEVIEGIQVL
ncbi:ferrous iron transport protein B [Vagococcus sp.]|uniref:ferrous iron transport protein B n=1 Tax=Vagococcus sp. TaxID=1933889 RepID=UPI000EE090B8|nr:ferrous iron transport protein B [Vagococcus sp.]HCT96692.1 ferrous iron transport protein B [Vagococcus sp.]